MNIIHLSFECYPIAKTGGLADVVGSLPKYQRNLGADAWVVMPRYSNDWVNQRDVQVVHAGAFYMGLQRFEFEVHKVKSDELGFPLYLVHIPGKLDRKGIYVDPDSGYGYLDEFERYLSFQIASLEWLRTFTTRPDIIHCHDHHTALVPFMMTSCHIFDDMQNIPSVLTIHNGEYHGNYDMHKRHLLPEIKEGHAGYLDWGGRFNALSAGIRKAWKVTTVSETYMQELQESAGGLEGLLKHESGKCMGIINGIDKDVWDPAKDVMLDYHYTAKTVNKGKQKNKRQLCEYFNLNTNYPLISFIGRLVKEKGADILPDLISNFLDQGGRASFLVLGTGDHWLQERLRIMSKEFTGYFDSSIQYNETLSRRIYAGSDFLIMPSRVEPCGLNQMYAMRYGTIPIVREVGGLKDSVRDIGEEDGSGIRFRYFTLDDALHATYRAIGLYEEQEEFKKVRSGIMGLEFGWDSSAQSYLDMYKQLLN
ncbi:MAG: glycogen synthase [Balneolales bacterium]|nr:glycogen synthase [Balneolales bacterium]